MNNDLDTMLSRIDIPLIDELVKRKQLLLSITDRSITLHDVFITPEIMNSAVWYLKFIQYILYLTTDYSLLYIDLKERLPKEMREGKSIEYIVRKALENSPKEALEKYFYQFEDEIRRLNEGIEISEADSTIVIESLSLFCCMSSQYKLEVQSGGPEFLDFTVNCSYVQSLSMAYRRDMKPYSFNISFYSNIDASYILLYLDKFISTCASYHFLCNNSSVTLKEQSIEKLFLNYNTLTYNLLNKTLHILQYIQPNASFNTERIFNQHIPRLLPSDESTLPQSSTLPTGDTLQNHILTADENFIGLISIGVKKEDYGKLKRLPDRKIGRFIIGYTYILDDIDRKEFSLIGGCRTKIAVSSAFVELLHTRLTSEDMGSGVSTIITTKGYPYNVSKDYDLELIFRDNQQDMVETEDVRLVIRYLNDLLGEGQYYLALSPLNKDVLLNPHEFEEYVSSHVEEIAKELETATISYTLPPQYTD